MSDGRTLVLERNGAIAKPVDLARVLIGCGLPLRNAHEAVTRLANNEKIVLSLDNALSYDRLVVDLNALGIRCHSPT